MKLIFTIIAVLLTAQFSLLLAKNYNVKGETRYGTFFLYCQSQYDSLDFIKLYDSKEKEVIANFQKSVSHFSPQENPTLKLIKLDYVFQIPLDFDLTDSLFHFGFKTRQQHDITYDYPFYILTNKPVSDLKLIAPSAKETDVNVKPLFQWTDESHPAIRSYKFQLSTTSTFAEFLIDTTLATNKIQMKIELEASRDYFWRVKSDFEENEIGYIGSSFSTGAKTVWYPFSIEQFHYAQDIQHIDSNRMILVDHQVGFQISDDMGVTWNKVKTNNFSPFKISEVIDGKIYATGYDFSEQRYKILKSTDNGNTWQVNFVMPFGNPYQTDKKMNFLNNSEGEFSIAFLNKILKYDDIETKNLIYETVADTSFITGFVELANKNIVACTESRYVQNDTDKGDIVVISKNGQDVKKVFSNYNGEKVDFCSINLLENGFIVASGIIGSNKSSIYLLSEDDGQTWKMTSVIENSKLRSTISTFDGYLISNFYDNPRLIVLSKDYGKTWIDITGNIPANYTAYDIKIVQDSILYYLSNSNKLYRTNIRSDIEMAVYPVKTIESNSDEIDFKWKKNLRAEKYNIQISLNENFVKKGIISEDEFFVDEETSVNKYQHSGFDLNTKYYWRVRSYYGGKWMDWYKPESFEIKGISGVFEFFQNEKFNISPNPANDFITISIPELNKWLQPLVQNVQIFNTLGIEVGQSSMIDDKNRIDISHLPTGIYFIRIPGSNGACSIVEKFVKM
jgi:photosystem II stability/assembly factor-like uncharacterized protein